MIVPESVLHGVFSGRIEEEVGGREAQGNSGALGSEHVGTRVWAGQMLLPCFAQMLGSGNSLSI